MKKELKKKAYDAMYRRLNYTQIHILIRNDDLLISRLKMYENDTKQSKNSIIQDALREYLYKRGY